MMLGRFLLYIAVLLTGFGVTLQVQGWIHILETSAAPPTTAAVLTLSLALAALATGARALSTSADRSRRPATRVWVLAMGAACVTWAAQILAREAAPGLLAVHRILGLAVLGGLVLPGMVLVGGLVPAWIRSAGLAPGQGERILPALAALGGAAALAAFPLYLLEFLGYQNLRALSAGLLALAGLLGGHGVLASSPGFAGTGAPSIPDRVARMAGGVARAAMGIGAGALFFLWMRYDALEIGLMPWIAWVLPATALFIAGLATLTGVCLLRRLPFPSFLAAIALAAAALLSAWHWTGLASRLLASPAPMPSFSEIPAVLLHLCSGIAPVAALTGLGFALFPFSFRPDGSALRAGRTLFWLGLGTALGCGVAAFGISRLQWQAGVLPFAGLAVASAMALAASRGHLALRIPVAILALAGLVLGLLLFRLHVPTAGIGSPTPPHSVHTASAWIEFLDAPDSSTRTRVRIDRRHLLGAGTPAAARVEAMKAWLPLHLHPAPKRILLLGESTGEVSRAALRGPGIQVNAVWVNDALEERFGPDLEVQGAEYGSDIQPLPGPPHALLLSHEAAHDIVVDLLPLGRSGRDISFRSVTFFHRVRDALGPGGLYCLWMPVHCLTPDQTRCLISTFLEAFPGSATAWSADLQSPEPVLGLVGTRDDSPLRLDVKALAARMEAKTPGALTDPVSLLMLYLGGPARLHRFAGAAPLNRDARPTLAQGLPHPPAGLAPVVLDETFGKMDLSDRDPASYPWPPSSVTRVAPTPEAIRMALATGHRIRAAHRIRLQVRGGSLPETEALRLERETAMSALEATPDLPLLWIFLTSVGDALIRAEQREEARRLFDRAVNKAPAWGGGYLGKATLLFASHRNFEGKEDWEALADLAEKALARDNTLARAWLYLGVAYLEGRHDVQRARGCFENAASLDQDCPLLKSYYWQFIERDGRVEEAASMLLDAYDADPRNGRLRDALYKLMTPKLKLAGKPEKALYILHKIEAHYKNESGYYLILSEVLDDLDDIPGALEAARRCCNLIDPPQQGYFLHFYRLLKKSTRDQEKEDLRKFMMKTFGLDPEVLKK